MDLAGRANSNKGTTLKFQSHRPRKESKNTAIKNARVEAKASAYADGGLYASVPPGFVYPSTTALIVLPRNGMVLLLYHLVFFVLQGLLSLSLPLGLQIRM